MHFGAAKVITCVHLTHRSMYTYQHTNAATYIMNTKNTKSIALAQHTHIVSYQLICQEWEQKKNVTFILYFMYYFNFITAVPCLCFFLLMCGTAIQCPIIIICCCCCCRHRSSNLYNIDLNCMYIFLYRLRLSLTREGSRKRENERSRRRRKNAHNRCDIESSKWNVSHI